MTLERTEPVGRKVFRLWFMAVLSVPALLLSCGDSPTDPAPPPRPDLPRPMSVSVSPASAALSALGETVQLMAEVRDQNGRPMAGANVNWTSSDDAVVTVSATGLVHATGNGEATVTASVGASVSGTAAISMRQVPSTASVFPAVDTLVAGDTLRLEAEAFDANRHPVSGATFAWSSSDLAVATVDTSGLVTAVGAGAAAITATSGGASGHMELLVSTPAATTIHVRPDSVTLTALGDTIRLTAKVFDHLGRVIGDALISWSSGDETVVTVDSAGLVTAGDGGTTSVTATSGEASGMAAVFVMQVVDSVVVSPAADTLASGDTLSLAAEALDGNGHAIAGAKFVWSSSDPTVATVDTSGLVTAVGAGAAAITATSGSASGHMELLVSSPAPTTIHVAPNRVALTAQGDTIRLAAIVLDQSGRVIENPAVSWSSADPSIATVDDLGLVSAHRPGSTRVSATSGNAAGYAELLVIAPAPLSVRVTPGPVLLSRGGETAQLRAEIRDQLGRVIGGVAVSWSSDDASVATVDATGLVQGVGPGLTSITATTGNARGSSQVVVGNPDRAVLAAFYDATDGPNWSRSDNWMTGVRIADWYGVQVDAGGRVSHLSLPDNDVSGRIIPELGYLTGLRQLHLGRNLLLGPIPPELGNLDALTLLWLGDNQLTGVIPPELAKLTGLRTLRLVGNRLRGKIPPAFGRFASLTRLELGKNRLSGPIPPEFGNLHQLELLNVSVNELSGPIPPELGKLRNLSSAELHSNNLTGSIPPELGDLGRLRNLLLQENELTGSIPATLGRLGRLEELLVRNNELAGAIPPELGNLVGLTRLELSNNSGLSGPLPPRLTALRRLETFYLNGTNLCAPTRGEFDVWLGGIPTGRVRRCPDSRGVSAAYLTQAVQSRAFPVPLVAGERALLRTFVTAARPTAEGLPPVRATFYLDGLETYTAEIPGQTTFIPTDIDEGDLAASSNAKIPAEVIQPGLEMVVEIDPEGTLGGRAQVTRRIPETGRLALDVRDVPTLDLTLIPFLWTEAPDQAVVSAVREMAADPDHELHSDTRTLLPIRELNVTAHEPVVSSSNNPYRLLDQTEAIWVMEGRRGHYMGMLSGTTSVNIAGLAYRPGRTSFSILDPSVMAHELGHNISLGHAPCGVPPDLDSDYPHADGSTGSWGYDARQGDRLVSPLHPDFMSYCDPPWISEYNFSKALLYRLRDGGASADGTGVKAAQALLLWGGTDEAGIPFLEPTFVVDAPAALPTPGGAFELAGQAADGDTLFLLRFDMPLIADGEGRSSFVFALPVERGWDGELASIRLSGPEGTARLDSATDRPMVILRERRSGQVRAFLRDPAPAALAGGRVDVGALSPERGLEALFSRGLPDAGSWRR